MGVCIEERPVMHWQQSARYFSPHERSNTSPTTANLTALNPGPHCYQPEGLLNRPSCLTCPTIGDHPLATNLPPHSSHFHPFHHPNMPPHHVPISGQSPQLSASKHLMTNQHAIYESCQNFEHESIRSRDDSLEENSNFPDYYSECKKEAITPPSSAKNNNNNLTSNNNDPSNATLLHLKTEPVGNPSSPESTSIDVPPHQSHNNTADDCAGCGRLIQDRFYLSAIDKKWHSGCLQCFVCENTLDGQTSLFCREGTIYCKDDYYRIYGARRCSKCLASISSSEMVMRARHLVYHVQCFSCAICNQLLNKGDQFGIRNSAIYCRLHFDVSRDPSAPSPFPCSYTPSSNPYCDSPNAPSSPSDLSNLDGGFYGAHGQHLNASGPNSGSISGLPQQPRQKGRPRKRKPKDIEAMTANLDLNSDYLDLGFGRGSMGSASSRAKRMRTSFKHHQLRTMKSYFAINHNPDAKDLKQLSQKTGLPKRVLQVWFQNARAKWRRMMMKQEGKTMDGEKGEGSIDLDTYSHSPSSYMLGPPSPTSME